PRVTWCSPRTRADSWPSPSRSWPLPATACSDRKCVDSELAEIERRALVVGALGLHPVWLPRRLRQYGSAGFTDSCDGRLDVCHRPHRDGGRPCVAAPDSGPRAGVLHLPTVVDPARSEAPAQNPGIEVAEGR